VGSDAVISAREMYRCAECGQQVIFNPRQDNPADLRLVCTGLSGQDLALRGIDTMCSGRTKISSTGERMRFGFRMELPGVTQEQNDAMHAHLAPIGADADGFVAHIAGPTQGGWAEGGMHFRSHIDTCLT
jgi:hypothetical protein